MEPARLEHTDDQGRSRIVPITASPFRIGRSTSNDLAVPSAEVSRTHAEIEWVDERFVLRDRESRAGTFVNDEPVLEHTLEGGDRIRIGPNIELVFAVGPQSPNLETDDGSSSTAISDLRQTAMLLRGLRALGSARVLDHVLELVLESAIAVSGAERGFLMLVSEAGALELKVGRGRDRQSLSVADFNTSRKIPEEVLRTGEVRVEEDLRESPTRAHHDRTIALGIRNVLCAPLTTVHIVERDEAAAEDRRIGVLYLDSRERKSFRSSAIRASLETLASEAAGAIENARLYRESQEKARLEADLQTAHEFQQALLPARAPDLGFFAAAARMAPCRMIGGDFFEYVTLEDGALGFTLGDVSGKGAPAGLLGARIQEIFSASAPTEQSPAATMARINDTLLRRSLESRFVTMVYGILYPDGRLRYCNAGHNPPVLIAGGETRRLTTGGLIVGLFDDATFEEETLQLSPGHLLVVFSDGISEATDAAGEEFGDARIIQAIRSEAPSSAPETVLARIFDDLAGFTVDELQGDDMTALVLQYRG